MIKYFTMIADMSFLELTKAQYDTLLTDFPICHNLIDKDISDVHLTLDSLVNEKYNKEVKVWVCYDKKI